MKGEGEDKIKRGGADDEREKSVKRVHNNEVVWEVEVSRIELNEDEYSERIVRLIKALLEIDLSQKQAEIDSRKSVDQIPRKAA